LLFAKGYVERSHYCLNIALKHLYGENNRILGLLNVFDKIRLSRHDVQYGGKLIGREEAEFVVEFAERFLETVKNELDF